MSHAIVPPAAEPQPPSLSATGRYLILVTAFLGWLLAGVQMSITPLIARSATIDLRWREPKLSDEEREEREREQAEQSQEERERERENEESRVKERDRDVGKWFSWYSSTFLIGAAVGGLLFGWVGDRAGRSRAMALSILCFAVMSGMGSFARSAEELLVCRFISCLGVGGMWPNGIALVSEAWSDVSRPALAGLIGTAANVGQVFMAIVAIPIAITAQNWELFLFWSAMPAVVVGAVVLISVPESPAWLAGRAGQAGNKPAAPVAEVFRPPLLWLTLLGIGLGTIPLLGGWGSGQWLIPWADQNGAPNLKAWITLNRSLGGSISSLLGGWLAGMAGRRRSYFFISLGSLLISEAVYLGLTPLNGWLFAAGAFMVGLISGFFFGWLPLCLPELFPTRVRSTGAGVTFNFGRIATAAGVFGGGVLIQVLDSNYARLGAITSLIYVFGMLIILFAPDTSQRKMSE